jgi:hypothetical protein
MGNMDGLRALVSQFQQETKSNSVLDFVVWAENKDALLQQQKAREDALKEQIKKVKENISLKGASVTVKGDKSARLQ